MVINAGISVAYSAFGSAGVWVGPSRVLREQARSKLSLEKQPSADRDEGLWDEREGGEVGEEREREGCRMKERDGETEGAGMRARDGWREGGGMRQ